MNRDAAKDGGNGREKMRREGRRFSFDSLESSLDGLTFEYGIIFGSVLFECISIPVVNPLDLERVE